MQEEIVDAVVVDDEPGAAPSRLEDPHEAPPHAATSPGSALVPTGSTALIDARGPGELVRKASKIATALDRIIVAQGLRVNMAKSGEPRWHVEVEGWQTLGTLLGLAAILRNGYPRPIGPPVRYTARVEHYEGKGTNRRLARITTYDVDGRNYEAVVDVFRNGSLISSARSRCDRTEYHWARAEEFAVAGMSHTRATARSLKQAAGWIVALAGYETTPGPEVHGKTDPGPPYGPPAASELEPRLRRALAYLLQVPVRPDGEPADEESFERVQDTLTALIGEADGYLPHVLARGVLRLAADLKTSRPAEGAAPTTPGGVT